MRATVHIEKWAMRRTFRIAGLTKEYDSMIVVELADGGYVGRGEGLPIHYLGETDTSLLNQVDSFADQLTPTTTRESLALALSAGGARNALDCAMWDLEAKKFGRSVWELTDLEPRPVATVFTVGIEETPQEMARIAATATPYSKLKIKLDENHPVECVEAIRTARPDAKLSVDANQAWTFQQLSMIAPDLRRLGVSLIEQPLPRGEDHELQFYQSPVPLCADESCQHRGDLEEVARRYQFVNIKLDKAGGLTEALALVQAVRAKKLGTLVSCMGGTSLSMAPAFVVAQLCDVIELDGPLLLRRDRVPELLFDGEIVQLSEHGTWGKP